MALSPQMYPALGQLRLISCSPDTPLRTVARMMATYRVLAILVTSVSGNRVARVRVLGTSWIARLIRRS